MFVKSLTAGFAVAVLVAGVSVAKTHHHAMTGGAYAAPAQPIPYAQLDAYIKATPKQRMAMMAAAPATPMAPVDPASGAGGQINTTATAPMASGAAASTTPATNAETHVTPSDPAPAPAMPMPATTPPK